MKLNSNGDFEENKGFKEEMEKKVKSLFNQTNPFHGKCTTCSYEICMKCGLEYHKVKNCKEVLDNAMKEFIQG